MAEEMANNSYNPNTSFLCYFFLMVIQLKKLGSLSFKEKNHNTVLYFCQRPANL